MFAKVKTTYFLIQLKLDQNGRKHIVHALIFLEMLKNVFFGRMSASISFGARQSASDVMKLNTLELLFDVEQIYILNRCDWMKNEENILYTL